MGLALAVAVDRSVVLENCQSQAQIFTRDRFGAAKREGVTEGGRGNHPARRRDRPLLCFSRVPSRLR